jgi:CRISPR-associated protein Csx10
VKVITYRITLLEPTLVTALDGDPNSAVTFNYLPGSVLRGAVIGKYLRTKNLTTDQFDAADPEAQRLFFDGTTCYLNGYPIENDKRTLPTPQSWQHEKGEETSLHDFAVEPLPPEDTEQWQPAPKPFCVLTDDGARLIQPDRHITVHTARNRRFGRPQDPHLVRKDEDPGAVYRYDALAAGQTFAAAILCDDTDAKDLKSLLTGEVTLGGSRSGGYGRVRFENAKEETTWREVDGPLESDADGQLIITLLSDALVRDNNGQFVVDPAAVTAALEARLGVPLTPYQYPDETEPQKWAYLRGQTIGGFNRKWGLPLPQALAVQMGSVFVYDSLSRDIAKLRELEAQGVGERRAEGFGRVAINWHTEPELSVESQQQTEQIPLVPLTDVSSRIIAERMVERMLRQRLDRILAQRANELGKHIKRPSNSQLSRLRAVVLDTLRQPPHEGRSRLHTYLGNIEVRQTTRKQFKGDHVAGKELLDWLRFRVDDDSNIWRELQTKATDLPRVGNVAPSLTPSLAYEYNLRLVHEVLALAAKERREGGK